MCKPAGTKGGLGNLGISDTFLHFGHGHLILGWGHISHSPIEEIKRGENVKEKKKLLGLGGERAERWSVSSD